MLEARNLSILSTIGQGPEPLDISLGEGEILGIVGGIASGKTRLITALAGLSPYRGEVKLNGKELKDYDRRELTKHIGVVFEDPEPYFFAQRVADEVAFPLENLGLPAEVIRRRIELALSRVGLADRYWDKIEELSGGQRHRLALAIALASDPRLLLLDNALEHLDPPSRKGLVELLIELKELGKGIIITGHSCEELAFADKLVRLKRSDYEVSKTARGPLEIPLLSLPSVKDPCQFKELWFGYRKAEPVLKGIGGTIEGGEIVALLGRNGAGKSTLARLLAGLEKPWSGTISISGLKPGKGASSLVLQSPDLQLLGTTPIKEVALSLRAKGLSRREAEEEAQAWLEALGIGHLKEERLHLLSRGAKRLLSIISCAALAPPLLILDEPSTGLDAEHKKIVGRLLERLAERGMALLVITHDLDFAEALVDRAWLMRDGELVEEAESPKAFGEML